MPRVEELLTPRELIDYTKERTQEAYMGMFFSRREKRKRWKLISLKGPVTCQYLRKYMPLIPRPKSDPGKA